MKQTRKDFFKTSGVIAAGSIAASFPVSTFASNIIKTKGSKMKLTFKPYTLELIHVFTVAVNSRTTTPVMLTEIEYEGIKGHGEASMPPYLGETQETAIAFLSKVNLEQFNDPFKMEKILDYVDSIDKKNTATVIEAVIKIKEEFPLVHFKCFGLERFHNHPDFVEFIEIVFKSSLI